MALRPRGNRGRPEPRRDITPINDRIRFPQVRVISETNEQLGVMDTRDAVSTARERGYDLILVAPQAQPPVCRIMDYGKYKYEKSKKEKKTKTAANEMKSVRLHPRTGPHDRDILVRHAERFLREGHKVRVVCQFKGRENAYPELGKGQLDAIAKALDEISGVEGPVGKQGREMTMMLAPKPGLKPLTKAPKGGKEQEEVPLTATEAEDAAFAAQQAALAQEAEEEAIAAGEVPPSVLAEIGVEAQSDSDSDGDVEEEGEDEASESEAQSEPDEAAAPETERATAVSAEVKV